MPLELELCDLSVAEKASLCSGQSFWQTQELPGKLASVMLSDGPHGVRKQPVEEKGGDHLGLLESIPATCFPTSATLASSWDRRLLREIGEALGRECREQGVAVLLGPGANIKRHPLCGRNFEYYSEDPLLTGELAAAWILGVQSQGVGASLKHFAVNNQEYHRLITDVIVDERSLRELYLAGFERAIVQSQPWTVMAAYNQVNGRFCCEHRGLLDAILRQEWGFEGLVVSDWGATHRRVEGIWAGMDLEMPGNQGQNDRQIEKAVASGQLSEEELDAVVKRILHLLERCTPSSAPEAVDWEAHHELARRAAAGSMVLLKNEAELLPLKAPAKLAVIGQMAREPRIQGNGSSLVNPTRIDDAWSALRAAWPEAQLTYHRGYPQSGESAQALRDEAVRAAAQADVALILAGLPPEYESEGVDRAHMKMPPEHDALIEAVAAANPQTIVALSNGAPVEMPWLSHIPAVLECYLGGQASGAALVDVLTGAVNPSGKLAETFPLRQSDVMADPYFPGSARQVQYREGLYVGYRYFDSAQKPVLFPFGHGLSYTTFAYRDLEVGDAGADGIPTHVSLYITNTGPVAGAEVVQLYVSDVKSTRHRPLRELKAFEKVHLEAGQTRQLRLPLERRSFAYYEPSAQTWQVEAGDFELAVGASSRDLRLRTLLHLDSADEARPTEADAIYPDALATGRISQQEFARILGHPIPQETPARPFHVNSTLGEIASTPLGKVLNWFARREAQKLLAGDAHEAFRVAIEQSLEGTPLRSLVLMGEGKIGYRQLGALIHLLNGETSKGLAALLRRKKSP